MADERALDVVRYLKSPMEGSHYQTTYVPSSVPWGQFVYIRRTADYNKAMLLDATPQLWLPSSTYNKIRYKPPTWAVYSKSWRRAMAILPPTYHYSVTVEPKTSSDRPFIRVIELDELSPEEAVKQALDEFVSCDGSDLYHRDRFVIEVERVQ